MLKDLLEKSKLWWRRTRRKRRTAGRILVIGVALARLFEYILRYFGKVT